jgi:hypothetical protein
MEEQFLVQYGTVYGHPRADLAFFIHWPQLRIFKRGKLPAGAWPYSPEVIDLVGEMLQSEPKRFAIWSLPVFPPGEWTSILDPASSVELPLSIMVEQPTTEDEPGTVYASW